jgi:hypothetical protein
VRRVPLLLLCVRLRGVGVMLLHLLRCHCNLTQEGVLREPHVLEFRLFGRIEGGHVGVVESLGLRLVDLILRNCRRRHGDENSRRCSTRF